MVSNKLSFIYILLVYIQYLLRVSPLFTAVDLMESCPKTHIFASQYGIFRDDSNMMKKRMIDAGVNVEECLQNSD